jgi:hypothetical protein|mmetsp:Transcript_27932/g.63167  ORF Transcript_27932/g.63167 Transcript_27932/m.63167 type:complete len:122 (-) Transcript_27932:217-582(-)
MSRWVVVVSKRAAGHWCGGGAELVAVTACIGGVEKGESWQQGGAVVERDGAERMEQIERHMRNGVKYGRRLDCPRGHGTVQSSATRKRGRDGGRMCGMGEDVQRGAHTAQPQSRSVGRGAP